MKIHHTKPSVHEELCKNPKLRPSYRFAFVQQVLRYSFGTIMVHSGMLFHLNPDRNQHTGAHHLSLQDQFSSSSCISSFQDFTIAYISFRSLHLFIFCSRFRFCIESYGSIEDIRGHYLQFSVFSISSTSPLSVNPHLHQSAPKCFTSCRPLWDMTSKFGNRHELKIKTFIIIVLRCCRVSQIRISIIN